MLCGAANRLNRLLRKLINHAVICVTVRRDTHQITWKHGQNKPFGLIFIVGIDGNALAVWDFGAVIRTDAFLIHERS
jgi:hypothetical protein